MTPRSETVPGPDDFKSAANTPQTPPMSEQALLEEEAPALIKQAGQKQTVLVTGHAGFIGFHVAKALLERGEKVVGFDSMNTHYDTRLKRERLAMLDELAKATGAHYSSIRADLCDREAVQDCFETHRIQRVIHLAGQTDKFLSNDNPSACVQNNINSFVSLLEACRQYKIQHLTYASSHAVYGAGFQKPMSESDSANHPQRLDAATQRACELMAHSYSHLFNLPTTGLRFFSVYGPWGRPDSVLFAFAKKILEGKPIQIYNDGRNSRDYTFISDLVEAILRTNDTVAEPNPVWLVEAPKQGSSSAPWRILNVGNSLPVAIDDLITALEKALDKKAVKEYITGQILEKSQSCADVTALEKVTGFRPSTSLQAGIEQFVVWFRHYYQL